MDNQGTVLMEVPACICRKCDPRQYPFDRHPHDHIDADTGIPCRLRYGSHEPLWLAETAINFLARLTRPLPEAQADAVRAWYIWQRAERESLKLADLSQLPPEWLRAPFDIFNRLFFFGAIEHARFTWFRLLRSTKLPIGDCRVSVPCTDVLIRLDPVRYRDPGDEESDPPKWSATALAQSLLHEMVHAFLNQYSCVGGKPMSKHSVPGCETEACMDLAVSNFGMSAHGRAWLLLAKAIEVEAIQHLAIVPDLGIGISIGLELAHGGLHPSKHDFKIVADRQLVCQRGAVLDSAQHTVVPGQDIDEQ